MILNTIQASHLPEIPLDAMKIKIIPLLALLATWRQPLPRTGKSTQPVFRPPLPDRRGACTANFTRQTGIKINRIEAKEDELLERIRNEGAPTARRTSFSRWMRRAWPKPTNLACSLRSSRKVLEERIPANLRSPDWFAFSTRARVIIANKDHGESDEVQNYEESGRSPAERQGVFALG
jgi:hypothetical protein